MKYLLYFFIGIDLLIGRENPFEETKIPKSMFSTKENTLKEKYFTLPSDAREIREIIIKYKTFNGSREAKIIDVNRKIDWRVPIVLSQKEKDKKKESKKKDFVEFVPFKFIKYRVSDDAVFIMTSANNTRNFMLPSPYKIILDFNYDSYFKTHKKKISKSFKVKSIATGSHDGFFRVALELVGKYDYKVEKVRNGYKITFK